MALVAFKVAGSTLLLNYGVHLGSSFAYSRLCMPQSVIDLATSFVATASPVCSFLLSTMQVTQSNFAVVLTTSLAAIAAGMLKPV
jgi:hypothetical protein